MPSRTGPNAWPLDRMESLLTTLVELDRLVKERGFEEATPLGGLRRAAPAGTRCRSCHIIIADGGDIADDEARSRRRSRPKLQHSGAMITKKIDGARPAAP